jgi:hypothetical protein
VADPGEDPAAPVPDAATIVGLLADDDRRRVSAALVLGESTLEEVREATGLTSRRAATALARLVSGDLVVRSDRGDHVLVGEAFRLAAMAAAPVRPGPDPTDDMPEDDARIRRRYVRGGRLTQIPSQLSRRRVVLDRLAQEFDVGSRYSERQVNAILGRFHEDVASLRRFLVDEGFLDRAAGEYWRSGGSVGT